MLTHLHDNVFSNICSIYMSLKRLAIFYLDFHIKKGDYFLTHYAKKGFEVSDIKSNSRDSWSKELLNEHLWSAPSKINVDACHSHIKVFQLFLDSTHSSLFLWGHSIRMTWIWHYNNNSFPYEALSGNTHVTLLGLV